MSEKPKSYKDTLNLPETDFPMRGDLVKREPLRLEKWESEQLYQQIDEQRKSEGAPTYILHDGPPFANGDVHMGTALNKVLKDFVVKSKTMAGFRSPAPARQKSPSDKSDGTGFFVMGHDSRLGQVVRNLLDNARSFSPPGSDVWINLRQLPGQVEFRIEDLGPGIPEENL
ncbi:MAG: class I tRNA ligase family protein, partial [Verrucomicrobiota bacterium]